MDQQRKKIRFELTSKQVIIFKLATFVRDFIGFPCPTPPSVCVCVHVQRIEQSNYPLEVRFTRMINIITITTVGHFFMTLTDFENIYLA